MKRSNFPGRVTARRKFVLKTVERHQAELKDRIASLKKDGKLEEIQERLKQLESAYAELVKIQATLSERITAGIGRYRKRGVKKVEEKK